MSNYNTFAVVIAVNNAFILYKTLYPQVSEMDDGKMLIKEALGRTRSKSLSLSDNFLYFRRTIVIFFLIYGISDEFCGSGGSLAIK